MEPPVIRELQEVLAVPEALVPAVPRVTQGLGSVELRAIQEQVSAARPDIVVLVAQEPAGTAVPRVNPERRARLDTRDLASLELRDIRGQVNRAHPVTQVAKVLLEHREHPVRVAIAANLEPAATRVLAFLEPAATRARVVRERRAIPEKVEPLGTAVFLE